MTRTAQCHIEELEVSLVEDLVVLRKFLEKTPSITKLKISHITSMHATSRLITVVVTAAPFYRLPIIIDPRLCMFPSIEENCPLRNSLYWTLLEDRFPASDDSRRYCDNDEIDCCHPHIGYTSSHLFRCSNGLFPPLGEASSGFYAPELCPSVSRRPWIWRELRMSWLVLLGVQLYILYRVSRHCAMICAVHGLRHLRFANLNCTSALKDQTDSFGI